MLFLLPWVALVVFSRNHLDTGTMVAVISAMAAAGIGLPTLWLTWAALREAKHSGGRESGLTLGQVADQLAVWVGNQWKAEAAMRRLNQPYPLPVSWVAADASLTDSWESLVTLAQTGAGWPEPKTTWAAGPDDLAGGGNEKVKVPTGRQVILGAPGSGKTMLMIRLVHDMLARRRSGDAVPVLAEGNEIAKVLTKVPTGRLVVLGAPGSGKTMLMIRLVLDMLARRRSGDPVPVLASVSSWNPEDQELRSWLSAQLLTDYPALAMTPPAERDEPNWAEALLAAGLILPVLDGLDEIPQKVRGSAVGRIDGALEPGQQVVVTCRTQQYRATARPQDDVQVILRTAAAIELKPLDADTVRRYLCYGADGPAVQARWEPVLKVLGTDAPVAQALKTPLMVGLARTIYNPRSGESAANLPVPADLCNVALADQAAVESLLFDAFVPAAYRYDTGSRWTAKNSEKWLTFFACQLESTNPALAWWQLPLAVPVFVFAAQLIVGALCGALIMAAVGAGGGALYGAGWGFAYGAVFNAQAGVRAGGMAVAVAGAGYGALVGVGLGVLAGCVMGISKGLEWSPRPVRIRWQPPTKDDVWFGVFLGTVAGVLVAAPSILYRFSIPAWVVRGIISVTGQGPNSGALIGGLVGVVVGFGCWVTHQYIADPDLEVAASPSSVLAHDRKTGITAGILFGTAAGVVAGVLTRIWTGVAGGISIGAGAAVLVGVISSFALAAWPSYEIARIWLALRRKLPWSLMAFLADAHKRGVLRQAGAVYQFRHIELQRRLADRAAKTGK